MRRRPALLLALALAAAWSAPAWAADPSPVGNWAFDPASLDAVNDRLAAAMAARVTPAQQAAQAKALEQAEARYARLQKEKPDEAARVGPLLDQMRARVQGMSGDPLAYYKGVYGHALDDVKRSRFELLPGGKLVYHGFAGGEPQDKDGSWTERGGTVEITARMPEQDGPGQEVRLRGPLAGDRIELKMVAEKQGAAGEPPTGFAQVVRDATWVLVRQ